MSFDWDIELFDLTKVKMCTGCKFEKDCFPDGSEECMELNNIAQMCVCACENISNEYRPEKLTYEV